MPRERSFLAGATDYTGVSMDDILAHVRDWRDLTEETIQTLKRLRTRVEGQAEIFEEPRPVLRFIDYFCDLFDRYAFDFGRLVHELPGGATESHVEIISQLYKSSRFEEERCIRFNNDFIEHGLRDERARPILDRVYAESRDMLIDYRDLSNLVPRLRTFISSPRAPEVVELKPGAWGFNFNLREAGRRLRKWWRRRRRTA